MIVHCSTPAEWEEAQRTGEHRPESLDSEGFIHCSTVQQVSAVANRRYPGRTGMVLLVIDEDLVAAEVLWERSSSVGEDFPHIYGPLNPAAVVSVVPYEPDADGTFSTPEL